MTVINVLLADDHTVLRQGIAEVIESQEDMHVIGQAGNGMEAIDLVSEYKPDVVLLDINMPEMDGVEATRVIAEKFPDTGVIILTMYKRDDLVVQAIKAGVSGYLLKEVEMSELLAAVRSVAQGNAVIDPAVASRVLAELRGDASPSIKDDDKLADRDIDILRLLGQGLSNQEIAEILFLSEKTVRNRLSLVFRKLNLKNRTEAALYAMRKGLSKGKDEEDGESE